jgi:hypothetical protein
VYHAAIAGEGGRLEHARWNRDRHPHFRVRRPLLKCLVVTGAVTGQPPPPLPLAPSGRYRHPWTWHPPRHVVFLSAHARTQPPPPPTKQRPPPIHHLLSRFSSRAKLPSPTHAGAGLATWRRKPQPPKRTFVPCVRAIKSIHGDGPSAVSRLGRGRHTKSITRQQAFL